MSRKTEIITAVCTFGCAMGIGFVMQSGEVAKMRYGSGELMATSTMPLVGEPPVPVRVTDLTIAKDDEKFDVQGITLTSAKVDMLLNPEIDLTAPVETSVPADVMDEFLAVDIAQAPECVLSAKATPKAAAMMNVSLDAPCYANQRVTVTHEGLAFTQLIPETGKLDFIMPALERNVRVNLAFLNGESISTFAIVPSVPLYDRVIVQWNGDFGVEIHAREFGADYGTEGHVWSGAPRDISAVAGGRGGFLTELGDWGVTSPKLAQVYTFPAVLTNTDGAIALTVETEVTEENCGHEIKAQTYQYASGKEIASQLLSLAVPNCSALGNFLVLNNLLQDLTVARK